MQTNTITLWLDQNRITNYEIDSMGYVNTKSSVDLSSVYAFDLPFQFGVIEGDFKYRKTQYDEKKLPLVVYGKIISE